MDYLSSRPTGLTRPWTSECFYATAGMLVLTAASLALFSLYPPNAGPAVSYAAVFALLVLLWLYCIGVDPALPVSPWFRSALRNNSLTQQRITV
jgi:hypothetical protein